MARTFPFKTPNIYTPSAANSFKFSYNYSDNMNSLMANNLLVVGEYPENLFWGGVSYEDVPQLYYGAIKYDYDNASITIDNLFDDSFEDVEFTPRQLSYAWIADTQNINHASIAGHALNWGIDFGEDFNNTSYLDPSKAGNFPNARAVYTYFADNIPVNKLGVSIGVKYINIDDWNDSNNTTAGNDLIQQTSLANFIGMRDNDPNYSKYRLVGFYVTGRQFMQADGTIRLATGSSFYFNGPANMLMSNYIRSIFSNFDTTTRPFYKIPIAASNQDRTKFTSGTYIYAEISSQEGFLVNDHTGVLLNEYNGDQTFDITDILNIDTKNTVKRLPYSNGDKYIVFGETTGEFYWARVGFQLRVAPVYNSLDDLLKVIAGYGLFFTSALLDYDSIDNDNIYAPVLDSDNIYHGEYTNGKQNLKNDYFEKPNNNESGYKPTDPKKEEDEDTDPTGTDPKHDRTKRGQPVGKGDSDRMPSLGVFSNYAVMDETNAKEFAGGLWGKPQGWFDKLRNAITPNAMEYFISLTYYPLPIRGTQDEDGRIYIGNGSYITVSHFDIPNTKQTFTFGRVQIKNLKDNIEDEQTYFYDYAPYTNIAIYLPFAGEFELNTNIVMGKTLSLVLFLDISNGQGIWELYNDTDNQSILIKQCQIGVDIPISGLNKTEMGANAINATFQMTQSTIKAAGGIIAAPATGGLSLGMVGGAVSDTIGSIYNLAISSKEIPQYTGGSMGAAACATGYTPYIIYRRPYISNTSNYGNTVGYMLNEERLISDALLTGYTVCRNVDVSGISNATSNERAQIKQILESGFYK